MLVTMVFQTLYVLIDLYWVGRLGTEAVAAVGISGNLTFIVLAITQMLGVGTTTAVSHAVGAKNREQALLFFNQSQVLSMLCGVVFLAVGLALRWPYARAMSADAKTAALVADYLLWFVPAMGLQFALVAMGYALRAIGNFKTGMIVSTGTIIINMVLAPFLIFGWGTGHPLGVAGAAIASLVAIVVGVFWYTAFFLAKDSFLRFTLADWKPRLDMWKRMLGIGLPAGFEFAMTSVYLALVYTISRPFGAPAQAAFGIGMRIVQAGFLPVVALAFSAAPLAGQNFGARQAERVRATFKDAALMAAGFMLLLGILCSVIPGALIGAFSKDPAVLARGVEYLRIVAWNFIASGVIFVASSMFQAMGNTMPSLITSGIRMTIVTVVSIVLSRLPGFQLVWIWYVSLGAVYLQLALAMWLLRREFGMRLNWGSAAPDVPRQTSLVGSAES
jgi:putative MATE family efflux protein